MSITFNNLRKDILGEDLATECDNDVAEILKKHIEIYELSKKPKSSQTMIQIGELYYQINVLISKRDALTNTITSNYLLSPEANERIPLFEEEPEVISEDGVITN